MALSIEKKNKIEKRLPTVGIWMIGTLLVQILVGTATALWLEIPSNPNNYGDYTNILWLNAHLWVGTAISVFATWIPIDAIRVKNRQWTIVSLIGLFAIVAAFGGGSAFLASAGKNDVQSFVMAVSCVVALAVYLIPYLRRASAK
jgi:thiol:disulfide interchange protein